MWPHFIQGFTVRYLWRIFVQDKSEGGREREKRAFERLCTCTSFFSQLKGANMSGVVRMASNTSLLNWITTL